MRNFIPLLLLACVPLDLLAQTETRTVILLRPGARPIVIKRPMRYPVGILQPRIPVTMGNRFDWKWAAPANLLADMPQGPPKDFVPAYQLLLPQGFAADQQQGLVLHLSSSSLPNDAMVWQPVCQKHKLIYASPLGLGDEVHMGLRLQFALAVLDDLRQRIPLDPDRVYISGVGRAGSLATLMAYSFPEFVGGVVAIGSASSLRAEPWMRDRVRQRLSVALIGGQLDPARHELERVRAKVLEESDIPHKLVVVPNMAAGLPPAAVLDQTIAWLESSRAKRVQLAGRFPPTRLVGPGMPSAEEWSHSLVEEGKARLNLNRTDEGLSLLEGVLHRWPGTPAARDAKAALEAHDALGKRTWQEWHNVRQLQHFRREAQALDAYLKMVTTIRGLRLTPGLVDSTIRMYEQVENFGAGTPEGDRATKRLEELRRLRVNR
jgi:hypothetical protein